jgi:hypothetical protein
MANVVSAHRSRSAGSPRAWRNERVEVRFRKEKAISELTFPALINASAAARISLGFLFQGSLATDPAVPFFIEQVYTPNN